jgi:hypothetical protein
MAVGYAAVSSGFAGLVSPTMAKYRLDAVPPLTPTLPVIGTLPASNEQFVDPPLLPLPPGVQPLGED